VRGERNDGGGDNCFKTGHEEEGNDGMVAPMAVESAPELAETSGLESDSSEDPSALW